MDIPGELDAARWRIENKCTFCGFHEKITGGPWLAREVWEESGADDDVLEWLREGGYKFKFTEEAPKSWR